MAGVDTSSEMQRINGNGAMREMGWMPRIGTATLLRALRLATLVLGVGVVVTTGVARAQDDEDQGDDKTFEEKILDNIMSGIGATNMQNHKGIDYRERSPLVVPPTNELPPPVSTSAEVNAPNWPKDPDVAQRKAAIAASKKNKKPANFWEAARPLTPSELAEGRTAAPARPDTDPVQPGRTADTLLSPSQLGFTGGLKSIFHGNTTEQAQFKGEPNREALTQPPAGYQTPSPNFAYGTGPRESLNKEYNPPAGKYGD
jgi:hypothetical protein